MPTLSRELRKQLENTVIKARRAGEEGAHKAIESLAVHNDKPWPVMTDDQKRLRVRLRAHGRQLGDKLDSRTDNQEIVRLASECAYEHWHRMLFARFLAESNLLIEPESGVPITLDECRELATGQGKDWLALASDFAVRMLPQIFRQGDPVLDITLPPETRQELEALLKSLPSELFAADDSLGWVYQFWQSEQKKQVNESGEKIGADELPAVTQLFTEDYMVLFLLHNTLGAWWAGKVLAAKPEVAARAKDEHELRAACSVGGYEWTYLRFVRDGENGPWRPAAGTFDGWPRAAKDLKVLDPCMGSGHFLVFALPILAAFRIEQEGLSHDEAVAAVLRDNLFGLEIDLRCTQIAAFNLAWTAWRMAGFRPLPPLNLACSGLAPQSSKTRWLELADRAAAKGGMPAKRDLFRSEHSLLSSSLANSLESLYELFARAPLLGSLIDPSRLSRDLYRAGYDAVTPLLKDVFEAERDDETRERAIAAAGMVKAAELLGRQYTLTVTNVPYLSQRKQSAVLREYCSQHYPEGQVDLATSFLQRCVTLCAVGGSVALVSPQNWLFLKQYEGLRRTLLGKHHWRVVARLGAQAFRQVNGWIVNISLSIIGRASSGWRGHFCAVDATHGVDSDAKASVLRTSVLVALPQEAQLENPGARIVLGEARDEKRLLEFALAPQGIKSGDDERWRHCFWEVPLLIGWELYQSTVATTAAYEGRSFVIDWRTAGDGMIRPRVANVAVGRQGVAVSQMGALPATLYCGQRFDSNVAAIIPVESVYLPALWAFVSSPQYSECVRSLDQSLKVTNQVLLEVPFDLALWRSVASQEYPEGLPEPYSEDPTQWLFHGGPNESTAPFQVAVARLLGYCWPRQTGASFMDRPALGPDGLERHADSDGIVCLTSLQGERPAADRLRALLADAFGSDWSAAKQNELLTQVGYGGESVEEWLRDGFFEQHCALFHSRPFIWHIWDGLRDGFHALVNYHQLAAPNGAGRQTLEKLIYSYLGDWIDRQRADQRAGVEGADGRVAAATHLKKELEKILEGEAPYDIFVRWKPLRDQPIGWEPDINDGVRLNIRPFITAKVLNGRGRGSCILRATPNIRWEKDRGKEPSRPKEDFPWFWSWDESTPDFTGGREFDGNRWNNLHYSLAIKRAARERHKHDPQRKGAAK